MKVISIKNTPVKIEKGNVIYNPSIDLRNAELPETVSIRLEAEYTRIDFLYKAKSYYLRGGWVNMRGDAFIRPAGTVTQYPLVRAVNIPLSPEKHFFQSSKEFLAYTLFFPALPAEVSKIDIIEHEGPGGNWFNFYGVSLQKVKRELVMVNN
jgi:hypothetical protein